MATLGEKLDEVARTRDAALAGKVSNFMRARGLGYNAQAQMAERHGINADDWEALMYESDVRGDR